MLEDFEEVVAAAWENQKTPLERMYDTWVGEGNWEPGPQQPTYRIYARTTGEPFACHLCGSTDKWVAEGDEVRQVVRVFVCEHEPIYAVRAAVRQVSSVPAHQVGLVEETGRPAE